jgi:hypothetical protein
MVLWPTQRDESPLLRFIDSKQVTVTLDGVPMVLWPTYRDESALLRLIDSKQVTRDFRGSAMAFLEKSSN